MTKDEVKAAVLALPEAERWELLSEIERDEKPSEFQGSPEFDAELDRRLQEMRDGSVEWIDADEALEKIWKKHDLPQN